MRMADMAVALESQNWTVSMALVFFQVKYKIRGCIPLSAMHSLMWLDMTDTVLQHLKIKWF